MGLDTICPIYALNNIYLYSFIYDNVLTYIRSTPNIPLMIHKYNCKCNQPISLSSLPGTSHMYNSSLVIEQILKEKLLVKVNQ